MAPFRLLIKAILVFRQVVAKRLSQKLVSIEINYQYESSRLLRHPAQSGTMRQSVCLLAQPLRTRQHV